MMAYVEGLIVRYRRAGVLLDSNLLLLYVVGRTDPARIPRLSRTRVFTADDYTLLARIVQRFLRVVTTPHVLTEVNNLMGEPEDPFTRRSFQIYAEYVAQCNEIHLPGADIVKAAEFRTFGFTDAAISLIARREGLLVMTVDLPLYHFLAATGVAAVNFNHLRQL